MRLIRSLLTLCKFVRIKAFDTELEIEIDTNVLKSSVCIIFPSLVHNKTKTKYKYLKNNINTDVSMTEKERQIKDRLLQVEKAELTSLKAGRVSAEHLRCQELFTACTHVLCMQLTVLSEIPACRQST